MPAVLSKPLRGEFNESNWAMMKAELNKIQSEVKLSGNRKDKINEVNMHFYEMGSKQNGKWQDIKVDFLPTNPVEPVKRKGKIVMLTPEEYKKTLI